MMKRNTPVILLFFCLAVAFMSCNKQAIDYRMEFEKSYISWLQFKKDCGNSYQYRIVHSSWTGLSNYLEITIKNGAAIKRHFKIIVPVGYQGSLPAELEWVEKEGELFTHDNYKDGPITLDQVYENARTQWLVKRENRRTYFEAKNHGLISLCGYTYGVCTDDCFTGINIDSIEKL